MYNSSLAKEIQDVVENAISTSNYTELNKNITNAVNTSIAQIGTSQNRFYQNYEDQEITTQEHLEHVEGEIVNGDDRADYNTRRQAAMREEARARFNSRQAQEARRQAMEERRREEAARKKAERTRYQYDRQNQNPNRTQRSGMGGSGGNAGMGGGAGMGGSAGSGGNAGMRGNAGMGGYFRRQPRQESAPYRSAPRRTRQQTDIVPISRKPAGRISGTLLTVFGILGIGTNFILFMIFGMAAALDGMDYYDYFSLLAYIILPLSAISGFMMWAGTRKRHRIKRFYQYVRQLRGRAYCSIRELSSHVGRSDQFVLKDLRKMISLGMFPEGHIDDQETCVMLNGATYDQYRKAQNSYLARQKEERLSQPQEHISSTAAQDAFSKQPNQNTENPNRSLPPEVVRVLATGKQYIDQINAANAAIPGKIISDKLDHLENIIQKIYARVEQRPDQIDELDKFINYYLPTTLKLVNAYRDFDAQPVQGENIQSSKKEIEATLDTIIYAFETLLDSLYEDDAMDISTDISVLQTMFAQEGLTKSAFNTNKK